MLKCPFCKGTEIKIEKNQSSCDVGKYVYSARCYGCYARGPVGVSTYEANASKEVKGRAIADAMRIAEEKWNNR